MIFGGQTRGTMEEAGGDFFRTLDLNVHLLTDMLVSVYWAEAAASGCAQGRWRREGGGERGGDTVPYILVLAVTGT